MSDKVRINIEAGCPVFIEIKGVGEKLKSKVIGLEHDHYLILRTPAGSSTDSAVGTAGRRGELTTDTMIVVKYVYQGVAYGFQTHVLTKIYNPASLLFIAYPPLVVEQSLRGEKRYDCHFKCSVIAAGSEMAGRIVDINMGGCCCAMTAEKDDQPHLIVVGTTLEIKLLKPETGEQISIAGTVNNITEDKIAARVGISFENVSDAVKAELKELLFDLFII